MKRTALFTFILIASLFFMGCGPKIRISEEWNENMNLEEAWNSGKLRARTEVLTKGEGMTVLIKGKLPLGVFEINAIRKSGNARERVDISSNVILNEDPQANLRAKRVQLNPTEKGSYELFLIQKPDNEVIASTIFVLF